MESATKILENNCNYIKNTNLVKPQYCDDSLWNHHNPCSRISNLNKIFNTNW